MNSTPSVAMIVSNGIDGDSRVQKSAKYFADADFDTTLIGWNPDGSLPKTTVGQAKIDMVRRVQNAPKMESLPFPFTGGYSTQKELDKGKKSVKRAKSRKNPLVAQLTELKHRVKRKQFTRQHNQAQDASKELPKGVQKRANWRRDFPFAVDIESQFVPKLVELNPDVLYAHDYTAIGAVCEAANELEKAHGKRPIVIYDAHEYAWGLAYFTVRERRGLIDLERSYIDQVDGVITVSPILAELLQERYSLKDKPTLVLNVPFKKPAGKNPSLRQVLGLNPKTRLLVHTGRVNEPTGIPFLVGCLDQLPDVHLALIAQDTTFLRAMVKLAEERGVSARLHHHPFVPPDDVPELIRSADIGILPRPSDLNTDLSLPNKLFEYMGAQLPILTADNKLVDEWITNLGIGKVFKQGDVADLKAKLESMFDDLEPYRQAYNEIDADEYSWQFQCQKAVDLVKELLSGRNAIYS